MTTFRYKGQTAGGAKVSGVLRAYDEFEAADKLRESVAIITKLEAVPEKKESVLSRPVAFRVKEKELALLCSQFAIILASGLSVERCVSMVAAQTKNKYLRRMLDKVSEEVGAGYSLAQSFENNAPYLPKTFTETLRAGEQSGTLESCFQRLHAYYDRSAKTRAKIVSTLTYPVMVIIVAIVVFVIIIAVAVPAFTDAFTDLGSGSLPGVTRALMAVSAFFTRWWWLVLGVLALLVIAYLTFRRTERGRAAWRIVHGESVLRGRSHCDVCGHVLSPRDLVPVFSYVFSHGRCRYCGAKLSPRHAVGEAVAALVFVSLLLRYDISLRTLEAWAVACLLLACAFADLEGYIIPDRFIAVGVVLFIVTLFFVPDPGKRALDGLIGGVAVGGGVLLLALLMEKLLRRDAMGGGDIKLLFLTGLFLGWQKNLLCLLLACVVGLLWGLVRAKRGQQGLPWGPGIALAAWCAALFGQNLIDWYLSLL